MLIYVLSWQKNTVSPLLYLYLYMEFMDCGGLWTSFGEPLNVESSIRRAETLPHMGCAALSELFNVSVSTFVDRDHDSTYC